MKAEEIQVGDWFKFPMDVNIRIRSINYINENKTIINEGFSYDAFLLEDIEPIPITPKILEENGFIKNEGTYKLFIDSGSFVSVQLVDDICLMYLVNGLWELCKSMLFVHELQQAFRLCGIDKEIEL